MDEVRVRLRSGGFSVRALLVWVGGVLCRFVSCFVWGGVLESEVEVRDLGMWLISWGWCLLCGLGRREVRCGLSWGGLLSVWLS